MEWYNYNTYLSKPIYYQQTIYLAIYKHSNNVWLIRLHIRK